VTTWAFEMTGSAGLRRAGLSPRDRGGLSRVRTELVIALAARDGSNSGLAQELKMAEAATSSCWPTRRTRRRKTR